MFDDQQFAIHPALMGDLYKEPAAPAQQEQSIPPQFQQVEPVQYQEPEVEVEQEQPVRKQVVREEAPEDVLPVAELTANENRKVRERLSQLREKAEKAERERDEMLRMLEFERQNKPKYQTERYAPEVEERQVGDDEFVEGRDFAAVKRELRELKQQIAQSQTQSTTWAIEAKLKTRFNDFDAVVTRENIELLNAIDPETANALARSPDLYDKAVATYNIIKKYNINSYDKYEAEDRKIKENRAKPRSLASIAPQQAESPLSRANAFAEGLTPAVQKALRDEMESAIKNRNR